MPQLLLELPGRRIYHLAGTRPAVYYLVDKDAGGVLVNTPAFDPDLLAALTALAPLKFLYLPSARGARDLDRWREACGAESLAFETEAPMVAGTVDIPFGTKRKLTRTIDFLPMAGVTRGTCALRLKNKPGVIFFGPALEPGEDGWPTLVMHEDDYSMESRLFGALAVKDLRFEYAFTDRFEPGASRYGPGAGAAVKARIEAALRD